MRSESGSPSSTPTRVEKLTPVTAQMLKLVEAGVSKPVIQGYIEQTALSQPLTATDILALNEHNVSDDLVLALLKKAAAPPTPAREASQLQLNRADKAQTANRPEYLAFDPESYEFWWYHYAYPRALAAANERLFSSYRPFFEAPNDFGYYPPFGFTPQPLGRRFGPP